jgi:hypothetical protein
MTYINGKMESIVVSILDAICNRKFPAYVSNEERTKFNQAMIVEVKILMKEELGMQSIIMPEHLMTYTGKVDPMKTTSEDAEYIMLDNLENLLVLQFDEYMDDFRAEHISRWNEIKYHPEVSGSMRAETNKEITKTLRIYDVNKKEIDTQNSISLLRQGCEHIRQLIEQKKRAREEAEHKQFVDKLNAARRAPIQKTVDRLVLSDKRVPIHRI